MRVQLLASGLLTPPRLVKVNPFRTLDFLDLATCASVATTISHLKTWSVGGPGLAAIEAASANIPWRSGNFFA
jgi:hypothetical protein